MDRLTKLWPYVLITAAVLSSGGLLRDLSRAGSPALRLLIALVLGLLALGVAVGVVEIVNRRRTQRW